MKNFFKKNISVETTKQSRFSMYEAGMLLIIILTSLFLNIWNNDFTLGYHIDEPKKVSFIKENNQDFHHPILMLQSMKILNQICRAEDDLSIAMLGRILSAVFGVLIVLFSYLIFRNIIEKKYALMAALFLAVSPIIVIHAHYFKEDIIYTCFAILSLYGFIKLIQKPHWPNIILFGIATGLALSAQYKGILLILMFFIIPILFRLNRNLEYYKKLIISFSLSLIVFFIINYPILFDFKVFYDGVSFDTWHITHGHDVIIPAISAYFSFHLIRSIIPGITLFLTAIAIVSIIFTIFKWKKTSIVNKILLFYVLVFYFVTEATPLKPFPDFMRYVIPIVPVIIFFSVKGIIDVCSFMRGKTRLIFISAFFLLGFSLPFVESVQLVNYLKKDTRAMVDKLLKESHHKTKYETYASVKSYVRSLAHLDIEKERENGIKFLVASSFQYSRYFYGVKIGKQEKQIYDAYKKYLDLFLYPYREIKPAYKSFAFSNPTLRIIDIRKRKNGND